MKRYYIVYIGRREIEAEAWRIEGPWLVLNEPSAVPGESITQLIPATEPVRILKVEGSTQ